MIMIIIVVDGNNN